MPSFQKIIYQKKKGGNLLEEFNLSNEINMVDWISRRQHMIATLMSIFLMVGKQPRKKSYKNLSSKLSNMVKIRQF